MVKITDPDYKLAYVYALRAVEELSSGTTQPLIINCIETTMHKKEDYVVKPYRAPRMSISSSCKELIAAWMAMELDLYIPPPAIATISAEFVDTMKGGVNGYLNVQKSIGVNFANVYFRNTLQIVKTDFNITVEILNQMAETFAFDMLIDNPDRRIQKPNVLLHHNQILIFDHELAFSFLDLLPSQRSPTPWIFRSQDREFYTNHFFYSILRGNNVNFQGFTEKLDRLNDIFWKKVVDLIPSEWQGELKVDEIRTYLTQKITHKDEFADQLIKILQHA